MTNYKLLHSTQYALIIDAPSASGSPQNLISLKVDVTSPAYDGGSKIYSYDAGNSWTIERDVDLMFEVHGTPVPEPASAGLLALGGLGILAKRKKK